jgi:hypothetical protein
MPARTRKASRPGATSRHLRETNRRVATLCELVAMGAGDFLRIRRRLDALEDGQSTLVAVVRDLQRLVTKK